jgi:nucleotide-binding universal stress UspA family protein
MLKINKILYATDFSNCSKQAYPHALFLSQKYGAELHILHAITLYGDDPYNPAFDFPDLEDYNLYLEKHSEEKTDTIIDSHKIGNAKIIKVQKRGFPASKVILEYADDNDIDLIVMGTHGRRGLGYLFLGSIAEEVTRFARCPVYTIREYKKEKPIEKFNKILVPLDLSDHSKKALAIAKVFCKDYEATLEIIHVIEETIHPAFYTSGKSSLVDFLPDLRERCLKLINNSIVATNGVFVATKFKFILLCLPGEKIAIHFNPLE